VEAQLITNDLLPARELALDTSPLIVLTVPLLGHPPLLGDPLDVTVALGGIGVRRGAEHSVGTRWNHHRRTRMALIQGGVHTGSVIAAIAHEELDGASNLVEQGPDLSGIIDVAVGQGGC
jgi:hypothetical protein